MASLGPTGAQGHLPNAYAKLPYVNPRDKPGEMSPALQPQVGVQVGVTSFACSSAVLLEVAIAQVMVVKSTGIAKKFPGETLQRMRISGSATAAGGKEL